MTNNRRDRMSPITTHVLDTSIGRPARGVPVRLELRDGAGWKTLGSGRTNADGRFGGLLPDGHALAPGIYRLTFGTGEYFAARGIEGFYPEAAVQFELTQPEKHYHIPLLLNPFGYSTYRGS